MAQINIEGDNLDYSREHGHKGPNEIVIQHDQLEQGDLHQSKEENMVQFIDPNDLEYSKKHGFAKSGIAI